MACQGLGRPAVDLWLTYLVIASITSGGLAVDLWLTCLVLDLLAVDLRSTCSVLDLPVVGLWLARDLPVFDLW